MHRSGTMNNRKIKILCITGITAVSIILIVSVFWIYSKNDDNISDNEGVHYRISAAGDENKAGATGTKAPVQTVVPDSDGAGSDIRIKPDTKYVLQKFCVDKTDGEQLTEEEMPVPAEIIALNEDELQDYLDGYMDNLPLEEYLSGMISYEIILFDEGELILRKTYSGDMNEDEYYIRDENGEIVVYYSDRQTIYEYTGIPTEDLSDADRIKLGIGYYVSDAEELYALLESYSS